jgi:hypothetical protein
VLEPSLVSVAPDVVALELAWVVADGNSVSTGSHRGRRLHRRKG